MDIIDTSGDAGDMSDINLHPLLLGAIFCLSLTPFSPTERSHRAHAIINTYKHNGRIWKLISFFSFIYSFSQI